jgi:hypothetical protein
MARPRRLGRETGPRPSRRKRLRRDGVRRLMLAFYWPLGRRALSALAPSGSGTSLWSYGARGARDRFDQPALSVGPRLPRTQLTTR